MADHSKWFEILVAAIGVSVTATLGYGQWQIADAQNKQLIKQQETETKRAGDNIEVQVMSLVSSHLGNLSKSGTEFEASQRVVLAAAEYLTSHYGRTALAEMAAKISESNKTVAPDVQTRIQEATVSANGSERWYAVLASFPIGDLVPAQQIANEMLHKLQNVGSDKTIQLYKTKISNNYAIVMGGAKEMTEAVNLANFARSKKLAKDAFPQQDREWTLIGNAPFQ